MGCKGTRTIFVASRPGQPFGYPCEGCEDCLQYTERKFIPESVPPDALSPEIDLAGGCGAWCMVSNSPPRKLSEEERYQAYGSSQTSDIDDRGQLVQKSQDSFIKPEPHSKFPLREILIGEPARLRFVKRFNTALVLHPENDAEHSYYVALYAMLVADWLWERSSVSVDYPTLLRRALIHDMEEVRTGDFTRRFKHSDDILKKEIERCAANEFADLAKKIFPPTFVRPMVNCWKDAKDDTPEGIIISLADFLSVLGHMWYELSASNSTMLDHYESMRSYALGFKDPKYDLVREIADDAIETTLRIFEVAMKRRDMFDGTA